LKSITKLREKREKTGGEGGTDSGRPLGLE